MVGASSALSCCHRLSSLREIIQHLRRLCAAGQSGRVHLAADDAVFHGPAQGVLCPRADAACVGKVQRRRLRRCGAAQVPPQHDGQLLTGNVVIGPEPALPVAAYDAFFRRSGDGRGIPRIGGNISREII